MKKLISQLVAYFVLISFVAAVPVTPAQMIGLGLSIPSGSGGGISKLTQIQQVASGTTFYADYTTGNLNAIYSVGVGTATFTAANSASAPNTYIDSAGVIHKNTTANAPRFTKGYYDTTGFHAQSGVMVEAAGTNLLKDTDGTLNSGGVWTGWSVANGGAGTPVSTNPSIPTLSSIINATSQRLQYTGVGGDSGATTPMYSPLTANATVAQNNIVTISAWVRSLTGNSSGITIQLELISKNSSNSTLTAYLSSNIAGSVNSSWKRFQYNVTVTDATVDHVQMSVYTSNINNGNNVDVEFYAPQMEINPYATSWIPTTTTSLSRAAESLTYPISGNRTAAQESAFFKFATGWGYAQSTGSNNSRITNTDTKNRNISWAGGNGDFSYNPNSTDSGSIAVTSPVDTLVANTSLVLTGVCNSSSSPYAVMYSNGSLSSSYSVGTFTVPAWGTNFWVGSNNAGTNQLNGILQAVYFNSSALSAGNVAEIATILQEN